jgi:hypothetical protein
MDPFQYFIHPINQSSSTASNTMNAQAINTEPEMSLKPPLLSFLLSFLLATTVSSQDPLTMNTPLNPTVHLSNPFSLFHTTP